MTIRSDQLMAFLEIFSNANKLSRPKEKSTEPVETESKSDDQESEEIKGIDQIIPDEAPKIPEAGKDLSPESLCKIELFMKIMEAKKAEKLAQKAAQDPGKADKNEIAKSNEDYEVKVQKLRDGRTIRAEYVGGRKNGLSCVLNQQGDYEIQSYYAEDVLDGPTKFFFPNGKVEREIEFKDGKKEGVMTSFNKNGNIAMEVQYQEGLMNGTLTSYTVDGQLQAISPYKDGVLHGEMQIYNNGELYVTKYYLNGAEVTKDVFEDSENELAA